MASDGSIRGWMDGLADEDLAFVKRFVLASGSLKALAAEYGISYPTVRSRLDRLIAKVKAADDATVKDAFQKKVHVLVADGALQPSIAKDLLKAHKRAMKQGGETND